MSFSHVAVQLALRTQLLTCLALPIARVFEGDPPYVPVSGVPYLEEDFSPSTSTLFSFPAQGGSVIRTGLYTIRWFGVASTGLDIAAGVDALLACFTPGLALAASDGTVVRIADNPGPRRGMINPAPSPQWAVCTLTVPWWTETINA
jgi:hypothetical protein